jgi:NADH-quinone oxidoreductase subunit M
VPSTDSKLLHQVAFYTSLITFFISIFLWIGFDKTNPGFQQMDSLAVIPFANVDVYVGVDGISLFFILLTTFLTPLCILLGRGSTKVYIKEYMICFLILE